MIELYPGAIQEYDDFIFGRHPLPEGENAPIIGSPEGDALTQYRARMIAVGYSWHISPHIRARAYAADSNYSDAERWLLQNRHMRAPLVPVP